MRRLPPVLADTLLVLLLMAVSFVAILVHNDQCGCDRLPAGAVVLLSLSLAPLVLRRRWPLVTYLIAGFATAAYGMQPYPDPPVFFGPLLGLYTVASLCPRRISFAAAVITAIIAGGSVVFGDSSDVADLSFYAVVLTTAWVLGDSVRARREQAAEGARQAAAEERLRIARELHDVVSHHVSVIAIQAEAAQSVLVAHPEQSADAMAKVATTAQQALAELRRLVGVLRTEAPEAEGGAEAGRAPQPDLQALEALVASVRDAGLPVEVVVEGRRRRLPVGVELSAYRILQESLTNVLRHAEAQHARVLLRYGEADLTVRVSDDGQGANGAGRGDGHGIVGMRERVSVLGGDLRVGPGTGG
ncbi:MAG: sensor histidine kinase, partial [Actinomycetota bacterium]|nr:sensor histidine kinase [Actinomycetota bacterium]